MHVTRRQFVKTLAAAQAAILAGRLPWGAAQTTQPAMTRWQKSAAEKRRLTRGIAWPTHEPIQFLLRRGDHANGLAEQYARMVDPDNIRRQAAAGVRYGRFFFYKGFGIEYERKNMDTVRGVAELMHQLGMKISLYVGGTMFVETFYKETPEAINWEQRDQDDHWVPYGEQTYRHYACPHEPAYRDYIKRVLKIGIEEMHADQFAFDNIMLQQEPHSCRCARCMKAFTEFLRKRYPTAEAARQRFGLPDVESVKVNKWQSAEQADAIDPINDPTLQEWTRFRCETLAEYAGDFYQYVKSISAGTECMYNIKGVYSYNRYWANAVYHPLYKDRLDSLAFDTGGYDEHIDANTGALISQIRSYKVARKLDAGCEDSFADEVRAAVHMSFGVQKSATHYVGAAFGSGAVSAYTPIMEFFRNYNNAYYTDTQNVADVAVLRNWPSMAYSMSGTYFPTTLMEQVLIQYKVPFDLLFDEQLGDLSRYKAFILAGQECVSDEQAKLLLDYAQQGGSLILAGEVSKFDERRAERHAPLFPAAGPIGKGQILTIAEIIRADKRRVAGGEQDAEPGATLQKVQRMSPPQWVLPKNHAEIYATILTGVPGGLSITTKAPLTTVLELVTRSAARQTIAHFVNFDKQHPLETFGVSIRKQFDGPVGSVEYFSPDADEAVKVEFTEVAGRIEFTAPATRVYGMIVLTFA